MRSSLQVAPDAALSLAKSAHNMSQTTNAVILLTDRVASPRAAACQL